MKTNQSATVGEKLQTAAFSFAQKGIESPRLEAEILLAHLLKTNRAGLFARLRDNFPEEKEQPWQDYIQKRLQNWPHQYITEEEEFYNLPFRVTPAVLIPRPETEELVTIVLHHLEKMKPPQNQNPQAVTIIDVGTGSGVIAVSIAHTFMTKSNIHTKTSDKKSLQIIAIDISPEALAIAQENANSNQVDHLIQFQQGDLLAAPAKQGRGEEKVHIIVSNPPYIESNTIKSLQKEVRQHEPHRALDGGPDGLDLYRRLIPQAAQKLHPQGLIALEIGYNQGQAVKELLQQANFQNIQIHQDYQNHDRIVTATK
ncbi:peptide chain release factor N(5)-glutamine methyltransferase [Heliorestis convoluta]|uniref:Release factor glutamine methyltransferase n=1 Tax=Heliorestis convoluta TaxID=356322 RepID=A0A5Q2N496_9FIRM|nr:peptide chain release factor N(5)-glutamine methyltransferase [Heliorestis convoluta]QGG47090.1 peptide chain release factor N(5)-glutamine methyltransferase [Heliorestis convoluta]